MGLGRRKTKDRNSNQNTKGKHIVTAENETVEFLHSSPPKEQSKFIIPDRELEVDNATYNESI